MGKTFELVAVRKEQYACLVKLANERKVSMIDVVSGIIETYWKRRKKLREYNKASRQRKAAQ